MAEVVVDRVDPKDTPLLAHLYNQVFRPEREPAFFERRFRNRVNALALVARVQSDAVGFFLGMELKPSVFFGWLVGVLPDARRMGVASQLMQVATGWAKEHGYSALRFECHNNQRPMLHFAITEGYAIVGIRWDSDRNENLIILEKSLD